MGLVKPPRVFHASCLALVVVILALAGPGTKSVLAQNVTDTMIIGETPDGMLDEMLEFTTKLSQEKSCMKKFSVLGKDMIMAAYTVRNPNSTYSLDDGSSPFFRYQKTMTCSVKFSACKDTDRPCYCAKEDDFYTAILELKAMPSMNNSFIEVIWPSNDKMSNADMTVQLNIGVLKERCHPPNSSAPLMHGTMWLPMLGPMIAIHLF